MSVAAPALLVVYAFIAGGWGSRLLVRSRILQRSPVAAIVVWQALSISCLASVTMAGIALALPAIPATSSLAELLSACADALRDHYATPGGAVASLAGATLSAFVGVRAVWSVGLQLWTTHCTTVRQRLSVRLVGCHDEATASLVVESDDAAVYCLPGRCRTVVFTSAALARLDEPQTAAVLAHEQVHLRYRHHMVLSLAEGLRRAFPFVPLLRSARFELERLVEVHADDAAAKRHDRRTLATALLQLAEARTPVGGLGAGGSTSAGRVLRLLDPPRAMSRGARMAVLAVAFGLTVLPVALAAMPAISTVAAQYCPLDWVG